MDSTSTNLLNRLRQPGDQAAWARFVKLYTPLLYSWACRVRLPHEEAADLVQEVFGLLVQRLPEFDYRPEQSFRGWLRVVAHNKWRDWHRRRAAAALDGNAEVLADVPAPDEENEFWETEYQQHLVGQALEIMQAEFHPNTWRACWETVVVGRAAADVAAELGISEGAVYIAKSRVLKRLRQELDGLWE